MKTLHTPEPWFCDGDAIYNNVDCAGDPIAHVLTMPFDDAGNAVDARRIVACVNRLASFTTEQIEDAGFDLAGTAEWVTREQKVLEQLRKIAAQREQLLAALEELLLADSAGTPFAEAQARAAIAAVKGGAA